MEDERLHVGVAGDAVVADLAVGQRDQAIGAGDEPQLVRGHHERGAPRMGLVEQAEQRLLAGLVETDEGLVDEQQA